MCGARLRVRWSGYAKPRNAASNSTGGVQRFGRAIATCAELPWGRLARVYVRPDDLDLWVGGLAEDHVDGALVGELFFSILKEQFEALRDGDRFWYQRVLAPRELARVENTRLANVIRRNTDIRGEIDDNVFRAPALHDRR